MKYVTLSCIFYVLLSSFCLGLPQKSNSDDDVKRNEARNRETTTAEPKHNASSATVNNLLTSMMSTMTSKKLEIIEKKLDTTTPINRLNITTKTVYKSIESSTENLQHSIYTTTAIPDIVPFTASDGQRQFDILSFMGGSLFTFCLMAIGVVVWKAYKMQIERNYRTI